MDIAAIITARKAAAEADAAKLAPELQALLRAIPTLQQRRMKNNDQFLALDLSFEGAEFLSPFFGLAYALRALPEEQLLEAESKGLFGAVRTKINSWERGAITVSFFAFGQVEEEAEAQAADKRKTSPNRSR